MTVEAMRGCGYRKVGGLYLCGGGTSMSCDRLPYELKTCPTCGSGIKFTRGWTWLNWYRYAGKHGDKFNHQALSEFQYCSCPITCPICHPEMCTPLINPDKYPYGLLWVGEASYTPQAFVQEAITVGVSRRIPSKGELPTGPKNLKLGETWVLFAHIRACGERKDDEGKIEGIPGIFYAFRPTSLELLIWQSQAKPEYLEDLMKRGITPIIIPDGDEDHDPETKSKITADDRADVERVNAIAVLRHKIGK